MPRQYTLLIHAGCEGIARDNYRSESEHEHLDFLRQSLTAGRDIPGSRGHALEAAALAVLEDIRDLGKKGE